MALSRSDMEKIKEMIGSSTSSPAPVQAEHKCKAKPTTDADIKKVVAAATDAQFADINNKLNTLYTELQALKQPPTE